ncbi:MAG TPA: ferritin family protein [Elusimicrobiota bacterium]|nr:ferritin family protein [Elusimicrobiota bacterium]
MTETAPFSNMISALLLFTFSAALPFLLAVALSYGARRVALPWTVFVTLVLFVSVALTTAFVLLTRGNFPPTYVGGLFLGNGLLIFLYYYETRGVNAVSQTEWLVGGQNRGRIHLRHVLQGAIRLEEHGKSFYEDLALRLSDPDLRQLCLLLAREEEEHRLHFQKYLTRWLAIPADEQTLAVLMDDLRQAGLFAKIDLPKSSEKDLLDYAVLQEEKTAEFYQSLENLFPEAWKKLHIRQLVATERAHAERLRNFRR